MGGVFMSDKYFVNSDKSERHVIDENYVSLLPIGLIEISEEEYKTLIAPDVQNQLWLEYKAKAQALLDKTDLVCLRCYKAGVPFPSDWQKYTADLRIIVSANSGDPTSTLPLTPTYPVGT
jgi:hypothetical protein